MAGRLGWTWITSGWMCTTSRLDFLVLASGVIKGLPQGRSHLSDQTRLGDGVWRAIDFPIAD